MPLDKILINGSTIGSSEFRVVKGKITTTFVRMLSCNLITTLLSCYNSVRCTAEYSVADFRLFYSAHSCSIGIIIIFLCNGGANEFLGGRNAGGCKK